VSEMRDGIPQIMLRERVAGQWRTPVQISHSTYAALDPCIVRLTSGDLAVAWSDSRGGQARIYYCFRTGGAWSTETMVGDVPGEDRAPSMGVDASGRVALSWLNTIDDAPTLYFTRFLYFAPFGQVRAITGTGELPEPPLVVTARDGGSHVLWIDRSGTLRRIWYRRSHPDSILSPRLAFTPDPGADQTAFTATLDSLGNLFSVWATSAVSGREIHYQRRTTFGRPSPPDTTIERREAYLQDLSLAVDRQGAVHVAYASAPLGAPQIYYKRWRPQLGWECVSTEITPAAAGSANHPIVLPDSPGNVRLLYTGYPAVAARPFEVVRQLDGPMLLEVPGPAPRRGPRTLAAGPNPLRAGQPLYVHWSGAPAPEGVGLYDLGGRRIASATFGRGPAGAEAEFAGSHTRPLPSGVYFVRTAGLEASTRVVLLR